MKLRILLLAIVAFALSAPAALAHDGGSDKHAKAHEKADVKKTDKQKGDRPCRPRVGLVVRGTLVSVSDEGFKMKYAMGNRHAKRLAKYYGEELYFTVKNEKKTNMRVIGHGRVSLEELTAKLAAEEGGEYKVLVKARVYKRYLRHAETLTEATTPELYAKWVKVKMVEPESDKAEEAGEEPKTDDDGAGTDDGSATTEGDSPNTDGGTDA